MADRDIKENMHPFELLAAEGLGLTPEEVHLAVKFEVSPDALLAQKAPSVGRRKAEAEARPTCEEVEAEAFKWLREARARGTTLRMVDCVEVKDE